MNTELECGSNRCALHYSCFLSHVGAFWGAFLAPIMAVMVFNVVIFVCVMVVLVRHVRSTASLKKQPVDIKTIVRLMFSIGGVMFLFGLTWLFAILTISVSGLRDTFQILFTIFNSLQGMFIFLFVCVISSDARDEWKRVLTCNMFQPLPIHGKHPVQSAPSKTTETLGMSKLGLSNNSTPDSNTLLKVSYSPVSHNIINV